MSATPPTASVKPASGAAPSYAGAVVLGRVEQDPNSALQFCVDADAAPSAPGAYILQIDLAKRVLVKIASQPPIRLSAGRYLYCGSAKGPGGIRSRLARHTRRGKSVHWHIDQLTEQGVVSGSWIVRNGEECDLVAMLAQLPMPIPGFGSSDCGSCRSHLLYLPIELSMVGSGLIAR